MGLRLASIRGPEGPDFDAAESGHGMSRRDLDGLIETLAFEQVETGDPFFGLGERTVGDQTLVSPAGS